MYNKLKISDARLIERLFREGSISYSSMTASLAEELCSEDILHIQINGSRKRLRLINSDALMSFLCQRFAIQVPLNQWIEIMSNDADRSQQVKAASDSKYLSRRSFKGFLLKTCDPVKAEFRSEPLVLNTMAGTALFIEDYNSLFLEPEAVVVGIENGENFQNASKCLALFPYKKIVFVSRYPQSADLRTWLQSIDNQYIHFGDFDLAGIQIYLNEFYSFLGERASFFVPDNIEALLSKGNAGLYDIQYQRYKDMKIADKRLLPLVDLIHHYRKTYEQEGLI